MNGQTMKHFSSIYCHAHFLSTHLVKTDKSDLIATLMNYIINSNKNRTALTSNRFLSKTTGRISSGTVELMLLGMR